MGCSQYDTLFCPNVALTSLDRRAPAGPAFYQGGTLYVVRLSQGTWQVFLYDTRSCRRAADTLQCQCSGGKQRIVHPEQSISISKYLPPKGSPETFGFWRPFGDFSGGGKVTPPAGGISRAKKKGSQSEAFLFYTNYSPSCKAFAAAMAFSCASAGHCS